MGLFGVAIALVALPDLTETILKKDKSEFRKVLQKGFYWKKYNIDQAALSNNMKYRCFIWLVRQM